MDLFKKTISIRWADIDPNFHLRHSVYYDFGTQQRIEILETLGLTMETMKEQVFGPVLFREECVYKREIKLSDTITILVKVAQLNEDGSRWTFKHEFYNSKNEICAVLTLDGAWLDTKLRKLKSPTPQIALEVLKQFPRIAEHIES
ncbi:acyl-CoA thioesterase [Flavobacterium soyangense]|uniref:Thioesterase family protein n=1 Tax=Flavobacterium soyangense TaxID=2023265 RepID=A0A930UBM9_9FLAO|nr:acyl-CoA thioesterase [Flavobacterium soyangense]MBF2707877.1 thioesterase family protein [Flavobacterium soyangense]